jgi:WD40 repeat protein
VTQPLPKTKSPEEFYCSLNLAGDPADHLAIAFQGRKQTSSNGIGPILLGSYTADSHGNLTTKNTSETLLATDLDSNFVPTMSISPTGKLLAAAGGEAGFEIFHFNGSSPITHISGLLHASEMFTEFGWDAANHLYALSFNKLHVYTVTPTSIKEASDSPYSIPEATSVIVLSNSSAFGCQCLGERIQSVVALKMGKKPLSTS